MSAAGIAWTAEVEVRAIEFDVALLDRLGIGELVVGTESQQIHHVNPSMCRMLRRTEADLLGDTWEHLVPPEDVGSLLERARRRGTDALAPSHVPIRFVRPDGEIVQTLASAVAHRNATEECVVVIILDITERYRADQRLQLLLDNGPRMSLHLLDRSGKVLIYGGRTHEEITRQMEAARFSTVFDAFPRGDTYFDMVHRALAGESVSHVVEAHGHHFDIRMRPVRDAGGAVTSVAVISSDVTERERAHAEIRARAAEQAVIGDLAQRALQALDPDPLWRAAADALGDLMRAEVTVYEVGRDPETPELVAETSSPPPAGVSSAALAAVLPHPPDLLDGSDVSGQPTVTHTDGWATVSVPVGRPGEPSTVLCVHRRKNDPRADRPPASGGRWHLEQADSTPLHTLAHGSPPAPPPWALPAPEGFSGHEIDFLCSVTSVLSAAAIRFAMEREIRHQSLHDPLTGLPNRAALLDKLEADLRMSGPYRRTGVIFVDLDGFKTVNDTHGHRTGDHVLRVVAARLRAAVRPGDVVSRLAGDEFAVVCNDIHSSAEITHIGDRIVASLSTPLQLADTVITITASAGIAVSDDGPSDPERLLDASDRAMYAAKRSGPGRCTVHHEPSPGHSAPSIMH